jgi:parallel beta-helix repeat protein
MLKSLALGLCLMFAATAVAEAKTFRIRPGPDAQTQIQAALISAKPGDTVRLERGVFQLTGGLSLDVNNVTIRGAGMDKTVLSFAGQRGGAEGLLVTSDDVELRDFAVQDTKGDGIKSKGADRIRYYRVRVEWTRGPNAQNGGYGIYPVSSEDVLVEECVVRGASDAGIYVGQSRNIIVRRNLAELNVAGIEIENSMNADVFENVARRNTGGILVFDLPGLPQMGGHSTRIFRNQIINNNTPNFAAPGNIVASVPSGTGVIVLATRNAHIFENVFNDNGSVNVLISAFRDRIEDAKFNALPRDIVVRNNVFGRTGFDPGGDLAALKAMGMQGPDVLWDGVTTYVAGGAPRTEPVRISLSANTTQTGAGVRFLSLGLTVAGAAMTEAQPSMDAPAMLAIAEPAPVKLNNR